MRIIDSAQNKKFAAIRKYRKLLRHLLVPMIRKISRATEALLAAKAIIGHGCDTQASFVARAFSLSSRKYKCRQPLFNARMVQAIEKAKESAYSQKSALLAPDRVWQLHATKVIKIHQSSHQRFRVIRMRV